MQYKIKIIFVFLFLLSVAPTFGQNVKPAPTPDDAEEVVRVETELVMIPAIVTDQTGKPLTKLTAKNFNVFEDNKPQRLENFAATEAPFEIALLLDTSGSTRGEIGLIQRAAAAFIKALRPGDKVAIIAFKNEIFDGKKEAVVDILIDLSDDRAALETALTKIKNGSGTPFYEALEIISDKIFDEKPTEKQRGRQAIVALTDGVDSTSAIEFADANTRINEANLVTYFVQLNTEDFVEDRVLGSCDDETALRFSRTQLRRYKKTLRARKGSAMPELDDFCDMGQFERLDISRKLYRLARSEMETLAAKTGGKTFPINDLSEARAAFAQVAQDIGTQYSLGYYSDNQKRDGAFRKIRVELRGLPAGAKIQTREGYFAAKN